MGANYRGMQMKSNGQAETETSASGMTMGSRLMSQGQNFDVCACSVWARCMLAQQKQQYSTAVFISLQYRVLRAVNDEEHALRIWCHSSC
jgi:hypothetical protein